MFKEQSDDYIAKPGGCKGKIHGFRKEFVDFAQHRGGPPDRRTRFAAPSGRAIHTFIPSSREDATIRPVTRYAGELSLRTIPEGRFTSAYCLYA